MVARAMAKFNSDDSESQCSIEKETEIQLNCLPSLKFSYHHTISWPPPLISHLFLSWLLGTVHTFLQLGCFALSFPKVIYVAILTPRCSANCGRSSGGRF